ncbi:(2Fe-2S)-binding protein [Parvibaculum sp.]|jgi:isoquinoline 1-oxidoreductase alpha subunit|uniref:(2Fe-2S)-binding protein n=1 Tax=Parvibaculum sp. TaxID=2024848 RepID=UPI002FD91645
MSITLTVNGERHEFDVEPEMPLLWVLRDELGLTGTKFGCGVAACGACTVHVDGVATRTCVTPVEAADGASITTIEGLAEASGAREGELSALQAAWVAKQVPQCGYCQSGMLMAVSALLTENPQPTDEDIDAAITNVCRCGTYPRVRAAIRTVTSA